jgi:hypothetical protein
LSSPLAPPSPFRAAAPLAPALPLEQVVPVFQVPSQQMKVSWIHPKAPHLDEEH